MTKRDFFKIIIKLLGLYFAVSAVFSDIPTYLSYFTQSSHPAVFLWAIGTILVVILIFIALVFLSDKIVTLLRLDKGFDEDRIQFENFNEANLVKLAILILGGILWIDTFPGFITDCFLVFKEQVTPKGTEDVISVKYGLSDYFRMAVSGIGLLMGYLMFTNYKKITGWLLRKEQ
ncbi:hypothetical protein [Sinomicrobium soli]|uniref:hypothetical protein n=1 Tax=Sinomicrobium sp. N-1-3-6 TaxID=2219864 RepID=UPI000DCE944B|nr:hypothetical protein [Sinomicrobium sp. N-1-3-6]RAV28689.1 hypothetical protein DN748_12100 [Sinomicrobium sp. N-1-3-6]